MIQPFFNTPERIAKLQTTGEAWVGTPWRQNSCARGFGASCQKLPRGLYIENGALKTSFPDINEKPATVTATNEMEQFLDGRSEFVRLKPGEPRQPGDLVGLFVPVDNVGKRIRARVINHLGVLLRNSQFLHVLLRRNAALDSILNPPWSQTIVAVWRPIGLA